MSKRSKLSRKLKMEKRMLEVLKELNELNVEECLSKLRSWMDKISVKNQFLQQC